MPDFRSIWPKLEQLEEDRERLESHRQLSHEEFLNNAIIQYATCYLFVRAIQGCLDIGTQLIAILGLRKPKDNADIFRVLAEESILPQDFAQRLTGMVRFRNILVHRYHVVDFDKVYKHLQDELDDFRVFAEYIVRFIEEQEQEDSL